MLYITTRNDRDAFTAQRALRENRGPDGGMYLPFRAPSFSAENLDGLAAMSFGQRMAQLLNQLFQTKLTGWDMDFCVGRSPVRLSPLGRRVQAAEVWHNPGWCYDRMARELSRLLTQEGYLPNSWLGIALRIVVLFGFFGELRASDEVDISVVSGDFSWPISAYYARKWGLPIGNIICCCNENSELWNLLCHGQLRTDVTCVGTPIPEADTAIPEQLERLIYEAGGSTEVERYLQACREGGVYTPQDAIAAKLRQGLSVSVVSSRRIVETIPSVYRTHGYVLAPGSALAYAGLMDYRAKTGQTRNAVVLAEKSPVCDAAFTASALGVSVQTLKEMI